MDTTSPHTHLGTQERWITSGLLGIGLVAFAINASTTNLMLSKLMTSLRVELYHIHWVTTAFGIARTITIPALGWLSGRLGPRTLYLFCLGSFCAGQLGSALAWDFPSLIFFRIVTGAGGGLIPPLSMAIFYQIFPPHQRGMALGLSLMGWSIGPSVGPLMGGYLLEFASWRMVYILMLPLSGLGFLLAMWFLPSLQRPRYRRLDYYGLLSMSVAVSALLLALSQGRREGWDSAYIQTLLLIGGTATILFVIIELLHKEPLVEIRLLGYLPFSMAIIVLFLSTMAFRTTGPMFPVMMQRLLGFEALLVAWVILPSQIIYGICVLTVGRLSDRFSPQLLVVIGLLIYAATFVSFAGISVWTTTVTMAVFLIFRFVAEAFIVSPNNLTALRALPEGQVMMATGLMWLIRGIANTVGPAGAAVLWDQRYGHHVQVVAESSPLDAYGYITATQRLHNTLVWMGEVTDQISMKGMALIQGLLHTEASRAAWQDFLLANALVAIVALLPALLVDNKLWRRFLSARPRVSSAEAESQPSAGDRAGAISRQSG